MMRSVDALPARTEANLESVNGRSAEFFKTSVLYARRKLIPRLSFETSVIYRGTYGRKIPLSAMDDSCMILWWVKNKRPYQLFHETSWMCRDACQRRRSLWLLSGQGELQMLHKVASRCVTQPQQGSVTSHRHRHEH